MDYPIKIARSTPNFKRLENAIIDLLQFVEAGAIYVSHNGNNSAVIVTFVLKENCSQDVDVLGEKVLKFTKLYPDFIFKFINSKWADYGFKKGKLFFVKHCTYEELVYFEPDTKVYYPHVDSSKQLSRKAKRRFEIDIEAAVVIFRNVSIYRRSSKSVDAAFTMHQALRYIFICASEFLLPEFISSTCLLIHYDYIIDFAPSFKAILDKENDEDKEILIMLNEAYGSIQQNIEMKAIDFVLIDRAKAKIELMQREINRLFEEYIEACEQKIRRLNHQTYLGRAIFENKIPSNYILDEAFSKIGAVISESFVKTRSIYCFGYTTIHDGNTAKGVNYSKQLPVYHFYLLALNLGHIENAEELMEVAIREKLGAKYKVTILNHSINYLRKKNCNQKYFFNAIIANGLLVYNSPLSIVYTKSFELDREMGFVRKFYDSKMQLAQQFLTLGYDCLSADVITMENEFLHKTLKQVAIAHIHLFLGYHTGRFSMSTLFYLLKYIQKIELPFDYADNEENLIYQFLCLNSERVKHKEAQRNVAEYNNFLKEICVVFFEQAQLMADKEFKRLENKKRQSFNFLVPV